MQSFRASLVQEREPSLSAESKVPGMAGLPTPGTVDSEFMLYTLTSPLKDGKVDMAVEDLNHAAAHNNTEMLPGNCAANRRTTPVWEDINCRRDMYSDETHLKWGENIDFEEVLTS